MKTRDFVSITIFTVLYSICFFIIGGVMGILPTTMLFYAAVAGIPCGIIYMYMRAKAPKKGSIMIQSLIMGVLYFSMGSFWTFSAGILIGGFIAEFISSMKDYRSFGHNAIGFVIFNVFGWVGLMGPVLLAKEKYAEHTLKTGLSEAYVNELTSFTDVKMFTIALILTVIGSYIGVILGKKILRKHFEKAGIV